MAYKFEIHKDKASEYRVRFKYNSETMFSTEGYSSKASAKNAIESMQKNGPAAETKGRRPTRHEIDRHPERVRHAPRGGHVSRAADT